MATRNTFSFGRKGLGSIKIYLVILAVLTKPDIEKIQNMFNFNTEQYFSVKLLIL
jgi:hypothetical protein